ncbi:MAG TPA: AbrB/MazE/SpoVT family DNA-binding domain-containing protein [Candidatus Binatia bacterium]|nr:AbrB/MazE/SpoVT family DNA-binding domain-containing protein [Candidatus Binatia bacterium]
MLAKKTVKNQITLPKAIMEKIPRTDYFEVTLRGEEIVLKPIRIEGTEARLRQVRAKIKALGLTEKDIQEAIRWARGR